MTESVNSPSYTSNSGYVDLIISCIEVYLHGKRVSNDTELASALKALYATDPTTNRTAANWSAVNREAK